MAETKYLNNDGLLYVWQKIKALLLTKVDKVEGKGLSANDFTTEEKNKLSTVTANANPNVIEIVKVNGKAAAVAGKAIDITVPTDNKNLVNGAGYQTASQVEDAITTALGGVTQISYKIVNSLPASGELGVIYLLGHSHDSDDIYDEYIYVDGKFEKIGSTDIDLSGYLQIASKITNSEIDTIFAS